VRFYTVTHLINELQDAQAAHQLPHYLEKALRHQLVILDEFGYVPFSPTGAQLLFQFCAALHERVSLLITTNLPFSDWVQVLGDERFDQWLAGPSHLSLSHPGVPGRFLPLSPRSGTTGQRRYHG